MNTARTSTNRSSSGKAIASVVLGSLGLIGWAIPIIGFPIVVSSLVLGILGLKSPKKAIAIVGIVLASIGIVLTIANAAIGAYMGAMGQHFVVNQLSNEL